MSKFILNRAKAFRAVFGINGERTKEQEIVLAVLGKFCHANASSVMISQVHKQVDPLATCMAEGRREVIIRIQEYIHMDQEILLTIIREAEENAAGND